MFSVDISREGSLTPTRQGGINAEGDLFTIDVSEALTPTANDNQLQLSTTGLIVQEIREFIDLADAASNAFVGEVYQVQGSEQLYRKK